MDNYSYILQNIAEVADTVTRNHDKFSQEKQQQIVNDAQKAEYIRKSHGESFRNQKVKYLTISPNHPILNNGSETLGTICSSFDFEKTGN